MERLVVTDFTRFKDEQHPCIAGLTLDGHRGIRPLRGLPLQSQHVYLSYQECRSSKIQVGSVLDIDSSHNQTPEKPHIEDYRYTRLKVVSTCDLNALYDAISQSAVESADAGFDVKVDGKYIPINGPTPNRSIITLSVNPNSIDIAYSYKKALMHFTDKSGARFKWIPITDAGIWHAIHQSEDPLKTLQQMATHVNRQESAYLRIGIGRPFQADDGRHGYWLQVNGLYTSPSLINSFGTY